MFDLYLEHGSIKTVKRHADRMGLRTKAGAGKASGNRIAANGSEVDSASHRIAGGEGLFERGHIHYILTNPLYAGRIRHRSQIYDGQHPAIIDPAVWDDVQERLKATAGREEGKARIGFEDIAARRQAVRRDGDRLTPSHANKKGRRYRYYVSNRLVAGKGDIDKSRTAGGWRLPARPLEQQLAAAVQAHLRDRLPVDLLTDPSVDDIRRIRDQLDGSTPETSAPSSEAFLSCIARATIAPGSIEIVLDAQAVADWLAIAPASINADAISFSIPFQFRKRGVETRLVIGTGLAKALDETLIRSIAKAHRYYDAIKQGRTFEEIAAAENLSKRRILQVIDLAFLAPDIVKSIMQGDQPIGLTAKWLGQHPLPSDWRDQRRAVAAL